MSAGAGGLATLLEKKSRRMELAVYCLSRALESFALCLVDWGLVRRRQAPSRLAYVLLRNCLVLITADDCVGRMMPYAAAGIAS